MSYNLVRTAILAVCLLALLSTFLALNSTPSIRAAVIASIKTVANAMGAALFSMAFNSMAVLHIILAFPYAEYALTMTLTLQRVYGIASNLVLTFPLSVIHFFSALVSRRHYPSQTFNHNHAAAPNTASPNTASTAPAAASKTASLDDATNAVFNEIEDLERRLNGA